MDPRPKLQQQQAVATVKGSAEFASFQAHLFLLQDCKFAAARQCNIMLTWGCEEASFNQRQVDKAWRRAGNPGKARKAVKAAFPQWINAALSCLALMYSLRNFTQGNTRAAHKRGVTANSRNLAPVLVLRKMWTVFVSYSAFICKAAYVFKPKQPIYIKFPLFVSSQPPAKGTETSS